MEMIINLEIKHHYQIGSGRLRTSPLLPAINLTYSTIRILALHGQE